MPISAEILQAIQLASDLLWEKQREDGSWVGEVDLNPGPTAQTVMLFEATGQEFPKPLREKARRYLLRTQNPEGGWSPHFGASSEVSLSVECYVALRILGCDADSPQCARAREQIMKDGGLAKTNPWTQLYLGVLGVLPWKMIVRVPVELLLVQKLLPLRIDDLAYWVKVITVPMMLLGAVGPAPPIRQAVALSRELEGAKITSLIESAPFWVRRLGSLASSLSSTNIPGIRAKAVKRALDMIERSFTEASGDLGGNSCTAMNVLLSLHCLEKRETDLFQRGFSALLTYAIETPDEWRMQTCQSHVWDTGFALGALKQKSDDPRLSRALRWLKSRQILDVRGPWSRNVSAEPGGWCFGNHHDHFPVTDCTALAMLSLSRHDASFMKGEEAKKAVSWLRALQHESGGWSAYEKYRAGQWLDQFFRFKDIPNALSDLPKNDVSAKVIEALAKYRAHYPELEENLTLARDYLLSSRVALAPAENLRVWRGNYGVNFIYGTAFSAKALRALDGEPRADWAEMVRRFFLSRQNPDGGWGESDQSYFSLEFAGRGDSNPVQTAWALIGLCAAFDPKAPQREDSVRAVDRAVKYLVSSQRADGNWEQKAFLGTVFPGKVYFRYEYYSLYFPLMALQAALELGRSEGFHV